MNPALIIPAYNHGPRLSAVLADARTLHLPLIVVDDGSDDNTKEILARLAEQPEYADLTVLRHPENRGKGAALLTGFAEAVAQGRDWALCMDADGQHRALDAARLLDAARKHPGRPLVLGARLGMEGEHVPWTSRAGRGFSNFWVWACGGPRCADSQSGLRLYPLPEIVDVPCRARRYQYEVEVLVRARWAGMPVTEVAVGVVYQPKGERVSHFRPWRDFVRNSRTFSGLFFANLARLPFRLARRLFWMPRP